MTNDSQPNPTDAAAELAGKAVAVPETRELDLMAQLFAQRGARVLRCPLIAIHDAADAAPIEAWLARAIAGEIDDLILLTGEGLRRLLGFAARASIRDAFVAALGRIRKITRGPKPVRALREIGLSFDVQAAEPTTDGVIATLATLDLQGHRVGVQLYGGEPNPPLIQALIGAGARPDVVAPYGYASNLEDERVVRLIEAIAEGAVDVIAFTSASQVRRLWAVAGKAGLEPALRHGLTHTVVAAVGPVTAAEAVKFGMTPEVMPPRVHAMKPLVNEIARAVQAPSRPGLAG